MTCKAGLGIDIPTKVFDHPVMGKCVDILGGGLPAHPQRNFLYPAEMLRTNVRDHKSWKGRIAYEAGDLNHSMPTHHSQVSDRP